MGKFFGLVACIGTMAMVTACGKDSQGKPADSAASSRKIAEIVKTMGPDALKNITICNKAEKDQAISTEANANSVAATLTVSAQDTIYKTCEGKENTVGVIADEAVSSVVIPGPTGVTEPIMMAEVSSERTCATVSVKTLVSAVTQNTDNNSVIQVNGDIKLLISNSTWKLDLAANVAQGKNLLKIIYSTCTASMEAFHEDGTMEQVCVKFKEVAKKEVVLNVQMDKVIVEGTRTIDKCATTGGQ